MKKTLIAFISVLLLFSFASCRQYVPIFVGDVTSPSEEISPVWDGSALSTDWYDESKDTFTISSAADLKGLADLVNKGNSFGGKTIVISSDIDAIDMGGNEWTPIGTGKRGESTTVFKGTFDGNGVEISNFSLSYSTKTPDDDEAIGFFGNVAGTQGAHAIIKNIKFDNVTVNGESNTAGVAIGYAEYADISNIEVQNSQVSSYQGAGAIIGRLYKNGSITGCTNRNTSVSTSTCGHGESWLIKDDNSYPFNAGGIAGAVQSKESGLPISIKDNKVYLTDSSVVISAEYEPAGGIAGTYHPEGTGNEFSGNTVEVVDKNQIIASQVTTGELGSQRRWFVGGYSGGNSDAISNNTYVVNGTEVTPPAEDVNPQIQ